MKGCGSERVRNLEDACSQLQKALGKNKKKREMLEKQIKNTTENLRNLLEKEG